MIAAVIISPAAERDLAAAIAWYEAARAGLSADFRLAADAALERIARHPKAFPLIGRGMRRALLHRFPHAVFYRHQAEAVQVVAVLHTSRDPRTWEARGH